MGMQIQIDTITCKYDAEPILQDLTLEIKAGEILGVIGPNGSGKSTLLKSILAQIKLKSGHIYIDSKDIDQWKLKERAKVLAFVPQESTMPFSYTVMEVVMMGRQPHLSFFENEGEKDMKLAQKAMEATNTWEFRDRNVQELSGGERQRVVLARALTQEPKILLLDEPISNLDIHHQVEVLNLIRERNDKGKVTSVCVLHDLNLAARYCDRLALVYEGKIFAVGTPPQVLTRENISKVYNCNPIIMNHPVTGMPQVMMIKKKRIRYNGKKAHLIAGGGKGAPLMELLVSEGYQLSTGILNVGDTDWQVAMSLGIPITEEEPFAPISNKAISANKKKIAMADVIIVADTPIGIGNLANLEMLKKPLEDGKMVVILNQEAFSERDFTQGKATAIMNDLKKLGIVDANKPDQVISEIEQYFDNSVSFNVEKVLNKY